jgi:hypothetical protein
MRLLLKRSDITEVDVESRLTSSGNDVAPSRTTGKSLTPAANRGPRTIPGTGPQAMPEIPRPLDLPELHTADLPAGVYAEHVFVTVVQQDLEPRELTPNALPSRFMAQNT